MESTTVFKVIHGKHTQKEIIGHDQEGKPIIKSVSYGAGCPNGDVVDTKRSIGGPRNLAQRFNYELPKGTPGNLGPKFRPLDEPTEVLSTREVSATVTREVAAASAPVNPAPQSFSGGSVGGATATALKPNLDAMSFQELKHLAEEEEIDLKGARSKEEALKILRPALS